MKNWFGGVSSFSGTKDDLPRPVSRRSRVRRFTIPSEEGGVPGEKTRDNTHGRNRGGVNLPQDSQNIGENDGKEKIEASKKRPVEVQQPKSSEERSEVKRPKPIQKSSNASVGNQSVAEEKGEGETQGHRGYMLFSERGEFERDYKEDPSNIQFGFNQ